MAAQKITSSQNKLALYAAARELDKLAIPLIPALGIVGAYREAFMARDVDQIDWQAAVKVIS